MSGDNLLRTEATNTPDAARNAMEHFGLHGSIGKIEKLTELVEVM